MRLKLFILVLALQMAWVLYTVATQEHALAAGRAVMLETQRIDPRDPLRGDYLILNYKISAVPTNLFSPPVKMDLPEGTKIFVALKPGTNQFFVVSRASTNAFAPVAGEVLLRGKSRPEWWWNTTNSIRVEYGLERYYVAEGTGSPAGKLTVRAIISASGSAHIKEVFINGKPYAEVMKPGGS
jgi:uncharacterized membrane-anchored protein